MANNLTAKSITTEDHQHFFLITETGHTAINLSSLPLRTPIKICLTDTHKSFTSEITESDLEYFRSRSKLDADTFYTNCCQALLEDPYENYVYILEEKTEDKVTLKLRKSVAGMLLRLIEIELRCEGNEMLKRLVERQFEGVRNCEERVKKIEEEKEELQKDLEMALETVHECVRIKDELEKELYGKFVMVLNEKKEKIREYEERLRGEKMEEKSFDGGHGEEKMNCDEVVVVRPRAVRRAQRVNRKKNGGGGKDTVGDDVKVVASGSKSVEEDEDDLFNDF